VSIFTPFHEYSHTGIVALSTNTHIQEAAWLYPRTLTYRERGSTHEHSHTGSVALPTNTHIQGSWLYPRTLTQPPQKATSFAPVQLPTCPVTVNIIALDSIQQFPHFCAMFIYIYIVEPVHVPIMREMVAAGC
jgi:hypothetical protein